MLYFFNVRKVFLEGTSKSSTAFFTVCVITEAKMAVMRSSCVTVARRNEKQNQKPGGNKEEMRSCGTTAAKRKR